MDIEDWIERNKISPKLCDDMFVLPAGTFSVMLREAIEKHETKAYDEGFVDGEEKAELQAEIELDDVGMALRSLVESVESGVHTKKFMDKAKAALKKYSL